MASCSLTNWTGCVSKVLGKTAGTVAGDAFDAIAKDFGHAAQTATGWLWKTMSEAAAVRLGGAGWETDLAITATLSVVVGFGLFAVQVTASTLRRDLGGLGRAFRGLVIAFVAGGVAIGVTNILLAASDALSTGIMQAGTGAATYEQLGQRITAAAAIGNIAAPAVLLLISLVAVMASVVVWAALMVRKLLILISAVFAPVAFTGSLADVTSSWVRKWIEMVVALIASKIILVVIFVVGLGVLDNGVGETSTASGTAHVAQSTTQLVVGCLILAMAGFAPWLAMKLVHFAGDSFHTIHAHATAAQTAGQQAIGAPQKLMPRGNSRSQSDANQDPSQSQPKTSSKPHGGDATTPAREAPSDSPGGGSVSGADLPAGPQSSAGEGTTGTAGGVAGAEVSLAVEGAQATKTGGQHAANHVDSVSGVLPARATEDDQSAVAPPPSAPPGDAAPQESASARSPRPQGGSATAPSPRSSGSPSATGPEANGGPGASAPATS